MLSFKFHVTGAEDECAINGSPALCAAVLNAAIATADDVISLSWSCGSGWTEMILNPGQSLRANLEQALDEINRDNVGFDQGEFEQGMAISVINSLLAGLDHVERGNV